MWYIEKDVVISAGHHLKGYDGACANRHGHNWKIVVYCKGDKLDKTGMLIDFKRIKEGVNFFDHQYLNDLFPEGVNSTAENLAERICEMIPFCYKVMVEEQEGSRCIYVKGE